MGSILRRFIGPESGSTTLHFQVVLNMRVMAFV